MTEQQEISLGTQRQRQREPFKIEVFPVADDPNDPDARIWFMEEPNGCKNIWDNLEDPSKCYRNGNCPVKSIYDKYKENQNEDNFNEWKNAQKCDYYDPRPAGFRSSNPPVAHSGVDIFGKRGARVVAPIEMRIIEVRREDEGGGGRYVIAQDNNGYMHYFAHLQAVADGIENKTLEKGELIGLLGNSGRAGKCHLHYQVKWKAEGQGWRGGRSENPTYHLKNALDPGIRENKWGGISCEAKQRKREGSGQCSWCKWTLKEVIGSKQLWEELENAQQEDQSTDR
jgi:murein DD-endopeptidase MepM/ murein hydrolase activator NlpD